MHHIFYHCNCHNRNGHFLLDHCYNREVRGHHRSKSLMSRNSAALLPDFSVAAAGLQGALRHMPHIGPNSVANWAPFTGPHNGTNDEPVGVSDGFTDGVAEQVTFRTAILIPNDGANARAICHV